MEKWVCNLWRNSARFSFMLEKGDRSRNVAYNESEGSLKSSKVHICFCMKGRVCLLGVVWLLILLQKLKGNVLIGTDFVVDIYNSSFNF